MTPWQSSVLMVFINRLRICQQDYQRYRRIPGNQSLTIDGKDVIGIIIEPSMMPISYRGVYYYRSGATKQELRGTALHQFLLKKMGLNWEDMPCDGTSLDDIDDNAINYFLTHAIDEGRLDPERRNSTKEEVLANLGLIKADIPTNGAVLLFGKYPQRVFVTSSFKIGRFGVDDSDLLNQDMISGNLIQMTDKIMQVLSDKYLIRPIHYEGLQRKEPLEIPQDALREMIFNSIVHKLQIGTWNQMSIYDDHIQLWNEGVLPEDYTVETLMSKHISKARNPKIAHVFFLAGFIEAWGRGYEKIMREFDKANLKHPTFREEHGGVSAIIPREIFMSIRGGQGSMGADDAKNDAKNITERQSEILEPISQNPHISLDAIAEAIGVSSPTIDREIAKMVNLVKRVGPKKGGYWEVIE